MPTATAKRRKGRVVAVAKKQHPAHRAVEHVVRNMRAAINEQWKLLEVPLARILLVMDSAPGVLDAVDWDRWERALGNVMLPHIQEAFAIGGLQAEAQMNVRKQDAPTLAGTFTINNPAAQRRAAQLAGELVTNASRASKLAIRDVVSRAFRDQRSIYQQRKEILRLLHNGIGLDRVRLGQLANYGSRLVDRGVSASVMAQRMTDMRHKLLTARALTIARQEANMAVHQGMDEMWRQYAEEDLIPKTAVRRWVVAYIKVCPICEPMNGQERPLGEDFVSPYNNRSYPMPPAHINCYCTVVLTDQRAKKPKEKPTLPAPEPPKPVVPQPSAVPTFATTQEAELWAQQRFTGRRYDYSGTDAATANRINRLLAAAENEHVILPPGSIMPTTAVRGRGVAAELAVQDIRFFYRPGQSESRMLGIYDHATSKGDNWLAGFRLPRKDFADAMVHHEIGHMADYKLKAIRLGGWLGEQGATYQRTAKSLSRRFTTAYNKAAEAGQLPSSYAVVGGRVEGFAEVYSLHRMNRGLLDPDLASIMDEILTFLRSVQ